MVVSRVTFVGVNNEGHGRVSSHGLVSGMVRLLSELLCLIFSFFSFTVLLESRFKSHFFSNLMIFGIYCDCSMSLYVPYSFLGQLFFLMLNLCFSLFRKSGESHDWVRSWKETLFSLLQDVPLHLRKHVVFISTDGTSATALIVDRWIDFVLICVN